MTVPTSPALRSGRSEWLETVAARCQWFVGTVMLSDEAQSIPEHASKFIDGIPDAPLPVDELTLRQLLLDVAASWGESLHEHAHARTGGQRCSLDLSGMLKVLVGASQQGPKRRFLEWARALSTELSRSHPVWVAHRAAAIIRERRGKPVDTATLAEQIGVLPQQLRRGFRQTFGVTIARYERHARLLRALEILSTKPIKIESLAREAGYASKKSFYDVFKRGLGMTPMAFIRLPSDSARGLIDRTRLTFPHLDT
jgi:AraC-like DNA-binding protein